MVKIEAIKDTSLRGLIEQANLLGLSKDNIIQIVPLKNETEFYLIFSEDARPEK